MQEPPGPAFERYLAQVDRTHPERSLVQLGFVCHLQLTCGAVQHRGQNERCRRIAGFGRDRNWICNGSAGLPA